MGHSRCLEESFPLEFALFIRQNDLFSGLAKKKFLYESEKKFVDKKPFYEATIFETGSFFEENLKINDAEAEKALNNKEAL